MRLADRPAGALLFLPVPAVLWLFTRAPLGVLWSLALGTALMATHRWYARPFALARAHRRCLWCAGAVAAGPPLTLREPAGATTWRACSDGHARLVGATLTWSARHARLLRSGILGAIGLLLVGGLLAQGGRLGAVRFADVSALFRVIVAVIVLPLGILAVRERRSDPQPRVPFPVHLQALIGTRAVLWLFRLVGLYWLATGVWHFAGRLP